MRAWLVIRREVARDCWTEAGCANAPTAGDAFRTVVLKPYQEIKENVVGEYRVLPLDESGHFAIEFNLRDLDAEKAAER